MRNLDKDATEKDLRKEFLKYGVIKSVFIDRGTAEIFFKNLESAEKSLKSDGNTILN